MAVKHINENAKEESGILLSGKDAEKVFSLFIGTKDTKRIKRKKASLNALFNTTIKQPTTNR